MRSTAGLNEVSAIVTAVFEPIRQGGRADIRVGSERVDVLPSSANACPVSVVDAAPQIDLVIGAPPYVAVHELWSDDRRLNLGRLRDLLEAVRDGRHEREVETFKRCRVRIRDRFELEDGTKEYEHSLTATGAVDAGQTLSQRFQAY